MEIERKFKVNNYSYRANLKPILYIQGYLNSHRQRTVRIRIIDDQGFMTVKGITIGAVRSEFEYKIPYDDAIYMLNNLCEKPIIKKYRYITYYEDNKWEIDEFLEENKGLVIAEIELDYEDQEFAKPSWVGEEVTGDIRYYNSNLITNPFNKWSLNNS